MLADPSVIRRPLQPRGSQVGEQVSHLDVGTNFRCQETPNTPGERQHGAIMNKIPHSWSQKVR